MEHDITITVDGKTKTIENAILTNAEQGKTSFYIADTEEVFVLPNSCIVSIIPASFRKGGEI
jgi:hypothetical protein